MAREYVVYPCRINNDTGNTIEIMIDIYDKPTRREVWVELNEHFAAQSNRIGELVSIMKENGVRYAVVCWSPVFTLPITQPPYTSGTWTYPPADWNTVTGIGGVNFIPVEPSVRPSVDADAIWRGDD